MSSYSTRRVINRDVLKFLKTNIIKQVHRRDFKKILTIWTIENIFTRSERNKRFIIGIWNLILYDFCLEEALDEKVIKKAPRISQKYAEKSQSLMMRYCYSELKNHFRKSSVLLKQNPEKKTEKWSNFFRKLKIQPIFYFCWKLGTYPTFASSRKLSSFYQKLKNWNSKISLLSELFQFILSSLNKNFFWASNKMTWKKLWNLEKNWGLEKLKFFSKRGSFEILERKRSWIYN